MVLKKWRQRRQSIRELKLHDAEIRQEYNRLREMDKQIRASNSQPPQYGDSLASSGETVFGMGSVRSSQASSQFSR